MKPDSSGGTWFRENMSKSHMKFGNDFQIGADNTCDDSAAQN